MPNTSIYSYTNAMVSPCINADDAMASMLVVPVAPSQTLGAGTLLGKVSATGRYAAYASGHDDGTQQPVGILRYKVTTDAGGNVTNFDEWGGLDAVTAMYTQGDFLIADLIGLDDNAVAAMHGHLDGADVAHSQTFRF